MTAEQCVKLGFDEIQHANFLLLNFFAKEVPDTRTPARFHAIGERGAGLDLQSQPVQDFIHLLRDKHVVSDPTLVAFEGMFLGQAGEIDPSFTAVADRLPPQVRRSFLGGGLQAPAGMEERYHQGFRAMQHMVGSFTKRGSRSSPAPTAWRALPITASSSFTSRPAFRRPSSCASRPSMRRGS